MSRVQCGRPVTTGMKCRSQPLALCPSPPALLALSPAWIPVLFYLPSQSSETAKHRLHPAWPGLQAPPPPRDSRRALGPVGVSGTGPKFRVCLCGGRRCVLSPPLETGCYLFF